MQVCQVTVGIDPQSITVWRNLQLRTRADVRQIGPCGGVQIEFVEFGERICAEQHRAWRHLVSDRSKHSHDTGFACRYQRPAPPDNVGRTALEQTKVSKSSGAPEEIRTPDP
jgi:hypothetical protein